ncbi:MAG: 1-acyl-sn-glycerol-3-phosphate acyltransferase [Calditrichaeota bacterium]|nr:MAG: 1-acyl-sn-glycerol-3-phosphate acyltransferase [Calditrichota bacterium]MBL1206479.1 1-acyl-sn-glycerol-3-phosphate acyltransferase [Calditrichota bacterium]NOG46306.1 1-acyl-sn-glycerol-3-phosphate acyltransferase [Calditrichota bacterium]
MPNNYITTKNYHTPGNQPRAFLDKMSMGTSAYFAIRFISKLLGNRRLAVANNFDTQMWATRSMDIFKLTEMCGARYHLEGLDNINKTSEPVVFIGNHMGMLETMIFPGLIASRREVTFVVKDSLVSHPLFGPVMRARKPITVERKDPMADFKKVMSDGVKNLSENISVVVFPQSQRKVEFIPAEFNSLGIKLAKKAKVPVVPVAIKTDFWKNGKWFKDIGHLDRKLPIYINFGEPFIVEGPGKTEHQNVIDFIKDNLNKWT